MNDDDDAIQVYEIIFPDAPGQIWYGVKVNGKDRNAAWADPEAARRRGEEVLAEAREGRGTPDVEPEKR